jgi:hypothetical protein|tara:strand:+ start:348 stop:698 length:351 start_codon:yes stop_codon:yes gene_type:complete
MISEDAVDAYNKRLTLDTSNPKKLTPGQRDAVKSYGSLAEALLKNRDLAMFVHHFKFEVNDQLANIRTHTPEANAERIAFANQLSGIDSFVNTLKSAVYKRNKLMAAEGSNTDSAQ